MPRMPRVNIEGALYYITSRGDHNQAIFRDDDDYKSYIDLLTKYKQQQGFKLYSYCLLSTHLNLLIELVEGVTISQIMHDLNSSYIKYFNKKYERTGHLFTERYCSVLIEKNNSLAVITACMHLRPLRKKQANELDSYKFSSYQLYISHPQAFYIDIKEEIAEIAKIINNANYSEFVSGFKKEDIDAIDNKLSRKRVIGSKEFKKKIDAAIAEAKEDSSEEEPKEQKKKVAINGVVVGGMVLLVVVLYFVNMRLQKKLLVTQEVETIKFEQRIDEEKKVLKQNLQERYAADQVSYRAMQKRMDIEKQRIKELEAKIETKKE